MPSATTSTTFTATASGAMFAMWATGHSTAATSTAAAGHRWPSRLNASATRASDSGNNSPSGLIRIAAPSRSTSGLSPNDTRLTTALAATSALWPVGNADADVVTAHPFTVVGVEVATDVWDIAARPTFVVFQAVWLVAVVARWRNSGRAASLVALIGGLALRGTPTAGVLAVCLVPVAAGWAIVHGQQLATHSALSWLARRSDDDAALPAELAEAIAEALAARRVVVWAAADDHYHAVGMWPEPAEEIVPVNDVRALDPQASAASSTLRRSRPSGPRANARECHALRSKLPPARCIAMALPASHVRSPSLYDGACAGHER